MKALVIIAALVCGTAQAATDKLADTSQHELPTHKAWGQVHDTLDVVEDPAHGVVCYVARQSDSHAMQMDCVKVK